MQWLANLSVRRPVLSTVIILVIVVVGVASYLGLGVDKFPKVEFPVVTVTTLYPGSSPEAVETDVTDKIEGAVNTIGGIESLTSISNEGVSLVIVQFTMEKDVDAVAQDVRSKIDTVLRDLPADIEPPQVQKIDPDASPILLLSVSGERPVAELTRIAEDVVKRRLETIDGVGEVAIIGGQKRRINIQLDPVRMRAAGVTALAVQRAIASSNADIPGGQLESGPENRTVRFNGRVDDPRKLADIVVRQAGDRPVRLRDVATVEDGVEDAESGAYRDGRSTIVLALRKQSGGNTVEVVDAAKATVAELAEALPDGVGLEIVRDNSESIRVSIHTVLEHLVLGGLFAALVVLLFLGDFRSTVVSAISIPVSLIGTFALMKVAGFTLDLMTLLALALSVGIVIDDSIVVLENIHRFIDEKKMKPFPAALAATKEIGPAVLATSLSLMAVFLPVSFMSGIVGKFLMSFGLTMTFAVLVSVICSFTIVPMLAARVLPPLPADGRHHDGWFKRGVELFYRPIEKGYMVLLRFSLRFRFVIVLASVGALMTVPMLAQKSGFGFLPLNDDAQFEVTVEAPTGTSLDQTAIYAERAAREMRALPNVLYTLTTIGDGGQQQENVAKIYVRLTDPETRLDMSQSALIDRGREALVGRLPEGVTVAVLPVADFSAGAKQQQVQYVISGPDLAQLEKHARAIAAKLAELPGAVDVSTTLTAPSPEAKLVPDLTRAAALGVSPGDVAATLRLFVEGDEASKYQEGNLQYDVYVQGEEAYRGSSSSLGLMMVPSSTLGQVPLSDVVTMSDGYGASAVNRLSRERQVTIGCNVALGVDQGTLVRGLEKIIADERMPAGYQAVPYGQSKEMAKMGIAFALAFLMAFVFMYLVLAAQFESWLHPLTILIALPLTLPFALLALVIFGQQLNIFSILGLLVLFGVVKKNGILQIDQANHLRAQGMPRREAILEANRNRLKPILMTTIAFVAGMLPLVFATGIGSGMSKAMATIVVGGQSLSLLLTLLAIPVFYSLFDDIGLLAGKALRFVRRGKAVDRGREEVFGPAPGVETGTPAGAASA
ncbi:MAG: efflux RND transporter permease subunit [Deltaproteobacteria bacterium]|nr:efflux RND transporter permease subunit [Deltaproteobacteria bacterium]